MPGETLAFDITGNAASATRAFRDTGASAAEAAKGARGAAAALSEQQRAALRAASAASMAAKADRLLAAAEREAARDALLLDAALSRSAGSVAKAVQAIAGPGRAATAAAAVMAAARATPSGGGGGSLSGTGGGLADTTALTAIAMAAAARNTRYFSDYISQGTPVWDAAKKGIFGLNGELALFGGALGKVPIAGAVTSVHLLADGIVETAGTLVPAAIAFSVFAAAAVPSVISIYTQMKNLYTVSQALGVSMPGLSGGFSKMAQAVQPEVYQLFGEGLVFSSRSTGTLSTLATGAGKVLDDLGARFVFATTQGKGFGTFADKASADLAMWGNNIGNVAGILGGLLKVMPGYAEVIANVFGALSHGIEMAINSPVGQWITGVGLAAHGAVTYIGLLATGFALLASRGLAGVASLALNAATGLSGLGAAGEKAAGGMLNFAAKAEGAAALPWGWISIAVAGLGFLAYQLLTAKDAAQQFGASMQQAISNAPLNLLLPTIAGAIGDAYQKLQATNQQITKSTQLIQKYGRFTGGVVANTYGQVGTAAVQYRQVLQGLDAEQLLAAGRINALSRQYGGQAAALALMNAAGITSAQVTDSNNQHWAQALIEIEAQQRAMNEMSLGTGRYAAAMNALGNNFATTLLPSMQKVTQAEDTVFSTLIGGEQAFTGFAQSLGQMGTDAKKSGASLSGLNAASLTLANDFYSTSLPAAQKVIDSLQQQQVSTGNLTKVVATEAAQMLPYTRGNIAAKVAIVDLINNALGPGTVSLQDLNKWVGSNKTTMQGYKAIVDQTQVSASKLAGTLSQDLNAMFAADLLKVTGADKAMQQYTYDLTHNQAQTAAGRTDRQHLITDLENAGYSARQATAFVDGLQGKIDGLHGKTVNVMVTGSGAGKITFNENTGMGRVGTGGLQFAATGGPVTGPGGPTSDSVPIMASAGEFVINAASAGRIGLPALNALNSFATGGLVGADSVLNKGVPFVASTGTGFAQAVESAFAQAALQKLRKDVQQSAAAANIVTSAITGGPLSGSAAAAQAFAKSILWAYGWTQSQWPYELALWNRESGWNAYAANPTSNARGIPQNINGWSAYAPGDYQAQVRWGDAYISGRYGTPASAWNHETQFGWYDRGGLLKPGFTLAYNGTGQPEQVIPAGRGGGGGSITIVIENRGVIGSQAETDTWLHNSIDRLARQGKLSYALRRSPSAA